jgi:protein phosphatase
VQPTDPLELAVPVRGIVLLVGAAGAGKSTFAARHFRPTEILSSDAFRALVGDDEGDQSATAPAFDVLTRVVGHRLRRGRLSVIDATNVTPGDRRTWLRLANAARRPTVAIVFNLPEALCQERNSSRRSRVVDTAVVTRQVTGVRLTLGDPVGLLAEGYAAVHVLDDSASIERVQVVRDSTLVRPPAPVIDPYPAGDATDDVSRPPDRQRRRVSPGARGPRGRTA